MHHRTAFEELLKYIPRHEFRASERRHDANRKVRTLDCWTWFGALLFGQIAGRESLRSIERPFSLVVDKLSSAGLRRVRRSTLAEANHRRPLVVLEETYARLVTSTQRLAKPHGLKVPGSSVLLLDSTVIDLCRNLNPWAEYRRGTSAVKVHATMRLDGDLPGVYVVTPAIRNDIPVARRMNFAPGTTLVFDRGYWDARWLNSLTERGIAFVTRQRRNNQFQVIERRIVDKSTGLLADQTVRQLASRSSRNAYTAELRRINYRDPTTGKYLVFLSNRFDLDAQTICALYKSRWNVELFFKALKQNFKIRRFLGRSRRAVAAQILVALIAYVLVQLARIKSMSACSLTLAIETIRTLALCRRPLAQILGPPAPESAPLNGFREGTYPE